MGGCFIFLKNRVHILPWARMGAEHGVISYMASLDIMYLGDVPLDLNDSWQWSHGLQIYSHYFDI